MPSVFVVTFTRQVIANTFVALALVTENIAPFSAGICILLGRVQVPIPQIQEQNVGNVKVTLQKFFHGLVEEQMVGILCFRVSM